MISWEALCVVYVEQLMINHKLCRWWCHPNLWRRRQSPDPSAVAQPRAAPGLRPSVGKQLPLLVSALMISCHFIKQCVGLLHFHRITMACECVFVCFYLRKWSGRRGGGGQYQWGIASAPGLGQFHEHFYFRDFPHKAITLSWQLPHRC